MYRVHVSYTTDRFGFFNLCEVRGWLPPASPREFLSRFGADAIRAENFGFPRPVSVPAAFRLAWHEWRVYALMRARGVPANKALTTVKRRGAAVTFLALLLIEKFGQDGAVLAVKGALHAPFGIERIINALDLPAELFPSRRIGWGVSASASMRLLRRVLTAIPYVA